jgi:ABC-type phosphate transport system substrate-binding protein
MRRSLLLLIAGLLLLAATACDLGNTGPNGPATATAITADNATVTAREPLAATYSADQQSTATAQNAQFAAIRPLIQVQIQDQGTTTDAGKDATRVGITVQNADKTAHQVVVRIYYKDAPLNTQDYGVGSVNVPASGSADTSVVWPLPFKLAAAHVLQIDNIWDYSPPPNVP